MKAYQNQPNLLLTVGHAKYFVGERLYLVVVGNIPIEIFGASTLKPITDYIRAHNLISILDEKQTLIIRGEVLDVQSLPFSLENEDCSFYIINTDGELESFDDLDMATSYIEEQIETFEYDITDFMMIFGYEFGINQVKYVCKRIRGEI